MSLKKFNPNDIILNTMRTHPQCEFFIYDSVVYYNNTPEQSGDFSANVRNVPPGFISLYEYNIDKLSGSNNFIYPYITKDSAGASFRTAIASSSNPDVSAENEWTMDAVGDILYGSYPLSSSIKREFMSPMAGQREVMKNITYDDAVPPAVVSIEDYDYNGELQYGAPVYPHYWALKNKFNYYAARSNQYNLTGAWNGSTYEWIKDQQAINLISIPSIFYGTRIKPGSLSLKWYFSGTLAGELRDSKYNGELIQLSGSDYTSNDGKCAGVVFYEEGFIALTGSWALNEAGIPLTSSGPSSPAWIYFGAGSQDGIAQSSTGEAFNSASFNLTFKGATDTQVMTMFAHAKRGEVNYSNNPTFLQYGQDELRITSSTVYEENPSRVIASVRSSSYTNYSSSFKRQVYVSRVGIYDESKNLMGIATLSTPILKEEDEDLTFKIRLDI
jgi:hypothetical protein